MRIFLTDFSNVQLMVTSIDQNPLETQQESCYMAASENLKPSDHNVIFTTCNRVRNRDIIKGYSNLIKSG